MADSTYPLTDQREQTIRARLMTTVARGEAYPIGDEVCAVLQQYVEDVELLLSALDAHKEAVARVQAEVHALEVVAYMAQQYAHQRLAHEHLQSAQTDRGGLLWALECAGYDVTGVWT